jgi:hypothetical protein
MLQITDMQIVYRSCIREYMSGIDRTTRDYKTQEVFTPDWMVDLILEEINEYQELDSVCLDRAVGDGQFAAKVLIGKMLFLQEHGMSVHDSFVTALDEIFGVDIEIENVLLCRERLLCGCTDPEIVALVSRRILNGNCLHPYRRLKTQTDQDHDLMKKYFTYNLADVVDPEPPPKSVKVKAVKIKPIKVKIVKPPKVKKVKIVNKEKK